jgi:transposase
MTVALLLCGYASGTRSSGKIIHRRYTNVACRIIVGQDIPDIRAISNFRKTHLARLEFLIVEAFDVCAQTDLAHLGRPLWMEPRSRPRATIR